MRKNMRKYENHFGEEPWIFNKIDHDYVKWLNSIEGKDKAAEIFELEKLNYDKFKWNVGEYRIRSLAKDDGLEIMDRYRATDIKKYNTGWDKMDIWLCT